MPTDPTAPAEAPRLPATVTPEAVRIEEQHPLSPPPGANGSETGVGAVTFTVAITVWKREHLLARALQSVLRQTHRPAEVLVLSDGRSKPARKMAGHLEDVLNVRYHRVRRRRKTQGNHLRRFAVHHAASSHLVILGHDSLLHRGYLAAHRDNLADDADGLSVVPVDYWRGTRPDGRMPRSDDVMAVGEGQIDLLCMALPVRLAVEADCFGEDMMYIRCADYLSFDRLRQRTVPVYSGGEPQAAHF